MASEIEDEQIETLKDWWSQNGVSLMAMTAIGVGGVLGYQAWDTNKRESGEAASAVYEDMVAAASALDSGTEDDNLEVTARNLAGQLRDEHGGSVYAVLASLHLAKLAVEEGDLGAAVSEFEWVLAQDLEEALEVTVRLRLARLLAAQEKTSEALTALDVSVSSDAHKSSIAEVKGDIYITMDEPARARDAYQLALDSLDEDVVKPMLALKLADIPDLGNQVSASQAEREMDDETETEDEAAETDAETKTGTP